jgi:hypothetical protein
MVRTEMNIQKQITNGSREQLFCVSRNIIRSCEVLLRQCRLATRKSCMKKAKYIFKKNVDSKFPAEAFFIDDKALTTVTMLWGKLKMHSENFQLASFNITLKRHQQSNFTTPPAPNLIKESLWKMSVGPIHRSIICTFGFSNTKI